MAANTAMSAGANAPSLDPLVDALRQDMAQVDATIIRRLESEVPLVPELAGHLITSGGKRMRPMMALAGAAMATGGGGAGAPAIKLAAAIEFIHSATLLHDDVIDESSMRRGKKTANAIWGNDAPVLVGDFLFARAFELMVETGNISVLGRIAGASARITEAEIKQMEITGRPDAGLDEYLFVIGGKTAILFAAAAAAGAESADGDETLIAAMNDYGMQLGLAFQMADDALDYAGESQTIGKSTGDDFTDQKITLPLILAWAEANRDERAFWQRTVGDGAFRDGDFETAQKIMARHDATGRALAMAREHGARAGAAVAPFLDGDGTAAIADALGGAAMFAAGRSS